MNDRTDRIDRLQAEAARLKVAKGAGRDGIWLAVGLVAMVAGVVGALVAYNQSLGESDPRDISSLGILAVAMLALAVVGAAVFLRYSLARFLRFWLLRQLVEGQDHIDQVVAALRAGGAAPVPAPPATDGSAPVRTGLTERQETG
jgi:hypothetical protein